ncbi:class I SAM-dependent methyltransferase [Polynucleobacter paneuropaeus]|nr:class I SAM-dependent methyltransferase [Polynucleobacter paneuropaeus]
MTTHSKNEILGMILDKLTVNISKIQYSIKSIGFISTTSKIFKYPIKRMLLNSKSQKIFNKKNIEDRFTSIYSENYWGNTESVSGDGSTLEYTKNLRKLLPLMFQEFSITSIFDAPCGDFNWMHDLLKNLQMRYIGGDIVLPLIQANNRNYGSETTRFIHIDLTQFQFPSVDLMICRDCLFHLSFSDSKLVIENFLKSDIKYLLTSTHKNSNNFQNGDIETGDFRKIDLFSAPYNFPKNPLFRIDDWLKPDPEREMCLWSREQVLESLNG